MLLKPAARHHRFQNPAFRRHPIQFVDSFSRHPGISSLQRKPLVFDWPNDEGDGDAVCVQFASLLRWCSTTKALFAGRLVHAHLISTSSETHVLLQRFLLQMYCKCDAIDDGLALFCKFGTRDGGLWNVLIGTCSRVGCAEQAFLALSQMQYEGGLPGKAAIAGLLNACSEWNALAEGRCLHVQIDAGGCMSDVVVGTALIKLYGKCGKLEDARQVFDNTVNRDVVCCTVMINAYTRRGKNNLAQEIFDGMHQQQILPSLVTIVSMLSTCGGKEDLALGKDLHAHAKDAGFEEDMVVGNALVTMYGKCGDMEHAICVFDTMLHRDMISYNAMISGFAQNGDAKEAYAYYCRMQHECLLPDQVTHVSLFNAYASQNFLVSGKRVHCCMITDAFERTHILENSIINLYAKCGCLEEASQIFDEMPEYDEVTWNVLMSGFTKNGQEKMVFCFFDRMQEEGIMPNKFTYVTVLSACASEAVLYKCKQFHARIIMTEYSVDAVVGTAIINMCGKCGLLDNARTVFDSIPDRNCITSTAMIAACSQSGQLHEAFLVFDDVSQKDDVLWNSIISACSKNDHGIEAFALFDEMLVQGVMPNKVTYIILLDAAGSNTVIVDGKRVHARIANSEWGSDNVIRNALVSMYGTCGILCGILCHAWDLFTEFTHPDVFAWSSMMSAYAQLGKGKETLEFFSEMLGGDVMPDGVTFVNALSACNHAGLLEEGCFQFVLMQEHFGIVPTIDHYNCVLDLFGRSGHVAAVEKLIDSLPVKSTTVTWLALLSAAHMSMDVKRGERAANTIFELDPDNSTPYLMLFSIYTAAGRPKDAEIVMNKMRSKGLNVEFD